ncbi:DUF3696 domain-containing protein [Methanococcoides sp. NM1]|uniref:AAA family ATPase n=1 Tax=Methanococcoides sp. NM1 TaxID=1201013 RepID=UPI00108252B1|nr:DUF3696 domain-containing protein [Methanococcoides sp. NM1]
MLKSLSIKNFKALKDTNEIVIKPITFFVGPNSSGKSSALQSLLALRQTFKSSDDKSPLILQDYIDLGSFKDIIWNHKEKLEFEIGFEDDSSGKYLIRYKYPTSGFNSGNIIVKYFEYIGTVVFNSGDEPDERNIHLQIKWLNTDKYSLKLIQPIPIGKNVVGKLKKVSNFSVPEYDFMSSNFAFSENMSRNEMRIVQAALYSTIASFKLNDLFQEVAHVGPLRIKPERVYTKSGAAPTEIGDKGKFTIDILLNSDEIKNIVKNWLHIFEIASDFKLEELKEGSKRYEMLLKDYHAGTWVTIADVGFGTSQVLPIIVECFSPNSSTVLIEEPEIHLHPKGQAAMGNLLVDAANHTNKSLIVETHSDLIISRVCTRIAMGDISPDDVAIHYFEPTKQGTKIHNIKVNEDGEMMDFPEGFFEERFNEVLERNDVVFERDDDDD